MYQWAWDGAQWVLVPIDRWEVGRGRGGGGRHHASHHAHRRAARAAQHMAAMQQQMTSSRKMAQPPGAMSPGTPTAGPPVGLQQHQNVVNDVVQTAHLHATCLLLRQTANAAHDFARALRLRLDFI